MSRCFVLDNGAGRIKFGLAGESQPKGSVFNGMATIKKQMQRLIGSDIDNTMNGSLLNFTRPFDRGYLINWGVEIDVWNHVFGPEHLHTNPVGQSLVVTEAPFTPDALRAQMDEVVFEEFQFGHYVRRPSSWFAAYEHAHHLQSMRRGADGGLGSASSVPTAAAAAASPEIFPDCCLVVESGFSFTHIVPIIHGKCVPHACKRVNVGGKLLTNYLKEIISYRQLNMMDEFKLMDQIKEELCYVSLDFTGDLKRLQARQTDTAALIAAASSGQTRSSRADGIRKFFVLPDFQTVHKGFVKPDGSSVQPGEQVLAMESERFAVPEVLFHPSDIDMDQAGVAEAAAQALEGLSKVEAALVCRNVLLVGGNTKFPNFKERFEREFRPFVPAEFELNVTLASDPIHGAWQGASRFAASSLQEGSQAAHFVSRAEYLEWGSEICRRKFLYTY